MNEKINGRVLFLLAIFCFPLGIAFSGHIFGSYFLLKEFFGVDIISGDHLRNAFTAIMGLLLSSITLFTPTKKLKSPLVYLANEIIKKWDSLKDVNDKNKKNNVYIEIIIHIIYLITVTSAYYYIIKNIVKYDEGYVLSSGVGVLTVFLFLIIVSIFVIFTSFIIGKLENLDENSYYDLDEKQQQKTYWSIGLIIGILMAIGFGHFIMKNVDNYIKDSERPSIVKSIYEILGGGNGISIEEER